MDFLDKVGKSRGLSDDDHLERGPEPLRKLSPSPVRPLKSLVVHRLTYIHPLPIISTYIHGGINVFALVSLALVVWSLGGNAKKQHHR